MTNRIQLQVIDQGLCLGCGLCESAIPGVRMKPASSGHYEPAFPLKVPASEQQDTILQCCPGIRVDNDSSLRDPTERLWGHMKRAFVGHSTDEATRFRASSGGALTAVLCFLLEEGRVDAVLQVGASISDPLRSEVHISRTTREITERSGSRYAPTSVLRKLNEVLSTSDRTAVVGKPCDISSLAAYLVRNPKLNAKAPYMFSFFCAGQPRFQATETLVDFLGASQKDISRLRYRGHGWPGKATVTLKSDEELSCDYEESWGKILGRDLHPRCRICPDGIGMSADIAFADAWELGADGQPDFSERPGQSLVIARTTRGLELINACQQAKKLSVASFDPTRIAAIQPYQYTRRRVVLARLFAYRVLGFRHIRFRGVAMARNAIGASWRTLLSQFLGTLKRAPRPRRTPLDSKTDTQG